MKEPWGKFYAKTFTGSMRGAGSHVIALMSYCVANARPPFGEIEINIEVVSFLIGEPVERMQEALDYLLAEDDRSRTPIANGRRLIKTGQFSYRLVNWLAHREGMDEESRRAYWRSRQAAHRGKAKKKGQPLPGEQRYIAAVERGADDKELDNISQSAVGSVAELENVSPTIKLRCPRCGKEMTSGRRESDPEGAVLLEITCPRCEAEGGKIERCVDASGIAVES